MLKVNLIGGITKQLELKQTANGKSVCEFDVAATNRGNDEHVNYLRVVVFGTIAENVVKFLDKGSKVGVSGDLEIDVYNKQDGSKGTVVKVVNADVEFLSSTKKGEETNA